MEGEAEAEAEVEAGTEVDGMLSLSRDGNYSLFIDIYYLIKYDDLFELFSTQ